jgi:hypothetical protein
MENKKQDVNSLEELVKEANAYSGWFANLADEISKVLADIKVPDEEEDTWEMKCPYEYGDEVCVLDSDGEIFSSYWDCRRGSFDIFNQGNIFPTGQAAELERKRRNLLTRFKAFRDECNDGWEPNFSNNKEKYYLFYSTAEDCIKVVWIVLGCSFNNFGYFKNKEDAERAVELFGDEIKALFVDCEEE